MPATKTEYDNYLELFRSILLVNPTVDPAFDPTLNPAIAPQLNRNTSELDKANFIRCLIVATIIEKYRDKAAKAVKHEKEKDIEVNNYLLKHKAFRHMLEELEEDDYESIEKKVKELVYKKTHQDSPQVFLEPDVIHKICENLAAFSKGAVHSKIRKPHP